MISKYGFGSAPMKSQTLNKNRQSLTKVYDFLIGTKASYDSNITDDISIVKGLFNRIIKQDQWDWFTVYMYFDYPNTIEISCFVNYLVKLRLAVREANQIEITKIKNILLQTNICIYINNFLEYNAYKESDDEYVYILSRREDKELLKIGMTKRNVLKRVQEINSATGVVYPIAPRAVFRVKDCRLAEKLIHEKLSDYRLRNDREFFLIPYKEAFKIIDNCLRQNDLYYYKY